MTWTFNETTGEITAPWGEIVATLDGTEGYVLPDDVQAVAAEGFRGESMTELSTDRIADYAEAWMGNIEVVE